MKLDQEEEEEGKGTPGALSVLCLILGGQAHAIL